MTPYWSRTRWRSSCFSLHSAWAESEARVRSWSCDVRGVNLEVAMPTRRRVPSHVPSPEAAARARYDLYPLIDSMACWIPFKVHYMRDEREECKINAGLVQD